MMTRPAPSIDDARRRQQGPPAARVPPHNIQAEESLLGAMLLSREAIVAAVEVKLTAADFYKPAHGHIFDAITSIHARGEPADPVTVAEVLGRAGVLDIIGGSAILISLQAGTPSIGNAGRYARIIEEHSLLRRLIRVGCDLVDASYDAGDPTDVLGRAQQALAHESATVGRSRLSVQPGGSFILDSPAATPMVWGSGSTVLWAAGEPLAIVGPPGVGKTTLGQQLALARIGVRPSLLGMPVEPCRRLLYIAADRPSQAQRSFRRMVSPADRERLDDALGVWTGPLPHDIGARPETLVEIAEANGADTIVIDSLKDVAVGLAKDDIGAAVNRALQLLVAAGVEVVVLHHQRKGQQGGKPTKLEDVYGSAWITAGMGSVLLVWGEAGDLVVELSHLKQPAEQFGPARILHDHDTGTSSIVDTPDALTVVRESRTGVTAQELAQVMFDTTMPEPKEVEKARRRLEGFVKEGKAHKVEGQRGGAAGGTQARYVAVTCRTEAP